MKTKRLFSWAVALLAGAVSHAGPSDLDKTFNGAGWRSDTAGTGVALGTVSVAVDSQGRTVVAATARNPAGDYDFAVRRYTAAGAPDPGFGAGGELLVDFLTAGSFGVGRRDDFANAVAIDGDDNIYVAGTNEFSATDEDDALVKISAAGVVLDAVRPRASGADDERVTAITLDGSGNVYLAGIVNLTNIYVVRLTPALTIDPAFNGGSVNTAETGKIKGVAVDSVGRILVAIENGYVGRYTTTGVFDTGYGLGGIQTVDSGYSSTAVEAIVVQGDDKVVVTGWGGNATLTETKIYVARLTTTGDMDGGFGTGGANSIDFGTPKEYAASVALQTDGKIVVGGGSKDGQDVAVARFLASGKLDTKGFNPPTGGVVDDLLGGSVGEGIKEVAIGPDGKIVFACIGQPVGGPRILVGRYKGGNLPKALADTWSQYRNLAITTFQYYAAYGLWDYAYGVYYYYTALGDLEFYNAYKDPATASYLYNLNLGYTYYYLYGQSNLGLYYLYLFWGYGYYYYFLNLGDFTNASVYFNALYGAALSVL